MTLDRARSTLARIEAVQTAIEDLATDGCDDETTTAPLVLDRVQRLLYRVHRWAWREVNDLERRNAPSQSSRVQRLW